MKPSVQRPGADRTASMLAGRLHRAHLGDVLGVEREPPDAAVVDDGAVHAGERPGVGDAAGGRQLGGERGGGVPLAGHEVAAVVQHHEAGDRRRIGHRLEQEPRRSARPARRRRGQRASPPDRAPTPAARSNRSSPSGPAISSAKNAPIDRPVTRRTTSPTRKPNVRRVVAVARARLPERRLGGQPVDHVVPVVEPARRHRRRAARAARPGG